MTEGWKPSKTKSGHSVTQFDIPRGTNRGKAPRLIQISRTLAHLIVTCTYRWEIPDARKNAIDFHCTVEMAVAYWVGTIIMTVSDVTDKRENKDGA